MIDVILSEKLALTISALESLEAKNNEDKQEIQELQDCLAFLLLGIYNQSKNKSDIEKNIRLDSLTLRDLLDKAKIDDESEVDFLAIEDLVVDVMNKIKLYREG